MKKVLVLLNTGFEEIEALTVVDYLRRAEIEVHMLSVENLEIVSGGHSIEVKADLKFDELSIDQYDLVYIPGGMPAAEILSQNQKVLELVKDFYNQGKYVASMCAGPLVLEAANIISDKTVTSFPGFGEKLLSKGAYSEDRVVVSENIITSRGPATAVFLALKLIEVLEGGDKSESIAKDILANYIGL